MQSLQTTLDEKAAPGRVSSIYHTGAVSPLLQKRQEIAQRALTRLNQILGGVVPFVILRIRVKDANHPFRLSELPAPVRAAFQSGDLLLDFPCHLTDDSIDGIARNGGHIILQALWELERSGIDIRNCSIFFIP
ncbi:MAG: hypothetical protein ACFFB3_03080 [Candidatus Hodarchaeota archaeon]